MDARHLRSHESSRPLMFGFSVIDTTMNTAGMDTKYISATTRRTLLALMPLRPGERERERLGMAAMVSASREAGKTSSATTAGVCDDAQYNSGFFHGSSLLVVLLASEFSDGHQGCVLLVHAQGQDHPTLQKVGDFSMKWRHLEDGRLGCGATNSWSMGARSTSASGACRSHTNHE